MKYVEKHIAVGEGKGKRALNPTTKVFVSENGFIEMELVQIGGVDEAKRVNEAELQSGAGLSISERVMTESDQFAESKNELVLLGADSRANMVSRSVIKDTSRQDFYVNLEARAKCFGHIECDAIIMGDGKNETVPALKAFHPDAGLTHEASIGKIADDQLTKLMCLCLTYDQSVDRIIRGFLR